MGILSGFWAVEFTRDENWKTWPFQENAATAAATFLTIISDVSIFFEERHKNVGFFASR